MNAKKNIFPKQKKWKYQLLALLVSPAKGNKSKKINFLHNKPTFGFFSVTTLFLYLYVATELQNNKI
jgi:hypothetical protein